MGFRPIAFPTALVAPLLPVTASVSSLAQVGEVPLAFHPESCDRFSVGGNRQLPPGEIGTQPYKSVPYQFSFRISCFLRRG